MLITRSSTVSGQEWFTTYREYYSNKKKTWKIQQTHRQQQPNYQKTKYLAKKNPILDSLIEMVILQTKIEVICNLISKQWYCKPPQWAGCEQGLDLVQGWCWSSQRRPTPPPSSPINRIMISPKICKHWFQRWFSWRNKSALENSHCAAFPPPMPPTFLHVFGCCHALTQPDPKKSFKYTPYHLIFYLLESLADFLGLELTAEMFELSVRKFPLSNDVLWRLLPVVPGPRSCRIQGSMKQVFTCLSYLWPSIPGL